MALILYEPTEKEYLQKIRQRGNPNECDNGMPSLCVAIFKFRSLTLAKELLQDGADPNQLTTRNRHYAGTDATHDWFQAWGNFCAFHIAVKLGEIGLVKLLLDAGADPNLLTTEGVHPLLILLGSECYNDPRDGGESQTSNENALEVLKLMINRGADINAKHGPGGSSLLHEAVKSRRYDITEYLLSIGFNPNEPNKSGQSPLYYVESISSNLIFLRLLLQNGADPNMQGRYSDPIGTALLPELLDRDLEGASADYENGFRLLHEYNYDFNSQDSCGKTVLHHCFRSMNDSNSEQIKQNIVKSLLENGADPNVTDELGRTPAFYIVNELFVNDRVWNSIHFPELLSLFCRYGMVFNIRDIFGEPLLHLLVSTYLFYPDLLLLRNVLDRIQDIDVNIKDTRGGTALHIAAAEGNWALGALLLDYGADGSIEDCDGNTPLHVAIECKKWEFAKCLLRNTAQKRHSIGQDFPEARSYGRRSSTSVGNLNTHHFDVPLRLPWDHWSCKFLRTSVGKYLHSPILSGINIKSKKRERESVDDPLELPIPPWLLQNPCSTSLYNMCEENSIGGFHLVENCGEEKCLVLKQVYRLLKDLTEKCAEMDPRLASNLIWTGSSAEGTKMTAPDEFDFMMEIRSLKDQCNLDSAYNPSITLTSESQPEWSDLTLDSDSLQLSPNKVLCYVAALIWMASLSLDRSKYPNLSFSLTRLMIVKADDEDDFIVETNVGVMFTFYWLGEKHKHLKINVDLTPAISIQFPENFTKQLHQHSLGKLNEKCHVIPYVALKNNYNDRWRLSFAMAELSLVRTEMTPAQVMVYKCLKFCRDMFDTECQPVVPSYHLKCFCFNLFLVKQSKHRALSRYLKVFPEGSEAVAQQTILLKVLSALSSLCFEDESECRVENFFITNKELHLKSYDMRWCRTLYEFLQDNVVALPLGVDLAKATSGRKDVT